MKVEFDISFDTKDLEEMCLERCKGIETAVPGHFEANATYNYGRPTVKCSFVADSEEVAKPVPPPAHPAAAEPNPLAVEDF